MKKQLAFVLSGGGARGALQVGALQAIFESGRLPDLLVGTSIGAVNAAFLALKGFSSQSLKELVEVWQEASSADLLPANYLWLSVRLLFGRPSTYQAQRIRDFFIEHGLKPELRFEDTRNVRLLLVATDLNRGQPVLYGQDPRDSILEGVLASTALPPWVTPFEKQGQLLIDGGVVSNLPIEAAMTAGATEIFALDLADYRDVLVQNERFGVFVSKLIYTVEQRQQNLELAMAAARGIPVTHLRLQGIDHVPLWDFHHTTELIVQGYQAARQEMKKQPPAPLGNWLLRWWRTRRRAAGPAS